MSRKKSKLSLPLAGSDGTGVFLADDEKGLRAYLLKKKATMPYKIIKAGDVLLFCYNFPTDRRTIGLVHNWIVKGMRKRL